MMNIIKIRNFLFVFLLLTCIFYPVTAVPRIISDSYDTYYTLIRNTKGNIWEPTGTNLQAAIDNMGTNGGTVYVGSSITLSDSLTIKSYGTIDFLGNTVTLLNDKPFINITSSLYHSAVRNVKVVVSVGHTSPVIHLHLPASESIRHNIRHNTFENIYIKNPCPLDSKAEWTEHNYTGIAILCEASNTYGNTVLANRYENIYMEGPKVGIFIGGFSTYPNRWNITHWVNGEYFKNIYIDQFESAVLFNTTVITFSECATFENLIAKTASYSKHGVMNISRMYPDFIGGIIDWHKAESPIALFSTCKQSRYGTALATAYLYANWLAAYDDTYMTDHWISTNHWNLLMANGKIQWEGRY